MLAPTEVKNYHNRFPLILALNKDGLPTGWINYERCCYYYAKEKVLWSLGKHKIVLRGGTNAITGQQSILEMDTIVAIDNRKNPLARTKLSPTLTNRTLFERDNNMCAYCGRQYATKVLTRDHVIPVSKGGQDIFTNVVTCCKGCNSWKGDKSLEEADLKLLYVPYVPSYYEHLILQNRNILEDQMKFLMHGVPKHSRLHKQTDQ